MSLFEFFILFSLHAKFVWMLFETKLNNTVDKSWYFI